MNKNINKKIQMIFAVIIIALAVSLPSMAEAAAKNSGKCGKNVTWSFDKTTGTLTISGKGDMYDYDDMNNRTAWKDKEIKKVIINEGVTKIGNYAFYGFYNLASVSIPDSMVTVGDYAFAGAAFLTSIEFPDNVTSIGELALNETSLGKIVIGKSYTDWKLDLPSGSLPGEEHTFDFEISKDNPKYMVLDGMVMTKDGKSVVCTEQNLIDVVIPDSVKVIEEGAFVACTYLKSIVIPEGVTSIGKRAFLGDESLKNISIPNSVTYIGEDAFRYCERLESLSIGSGLKDWNKLHIETLIDELKDSLKDEGIDISVGVEWRNSDMFIEDVVKCADQKMYDDKKIFYENVLTMKETTGNKKHSGRHG